MGQLAACGDDLCHGEILRVVDVQPLDAVYDGHPGPVADAAVAAAPQLPREDEEGAGLDVDRFDGLCARDVVERVVERAAAVPGEGLDALGAECRVVLARADLLQRLREGFGPDEGRGGVRQHVEVGFDLRRKAVVDLAAEGFVAVERFAAAQETHPVGQQIAHPFVAAEDIYLVDLGHLHQRPEDVAHQRGASQHAEVFARDTLAVEPYRYESYGFHAFGFSYWAARFVAVSRRRKPFRWFGVIVRADCNLGSRHGRCVPR